MNGKNQTAEEISDNLDYIIHVATNISCQIIAVGYEIGDHNDLSMTDLSEAVRIACERNHEWRTRLSSDERDIVGKTVESMSKEKFNNEFGIIEVLPSMPKNIFDEIDEKYGKYFS